MLLHIRVTGSAERSDGKGVEARLIAPAGMGEGTSIASKRVAPPLHPAGAINRAPTQKCEAHPTGDSHPLLLA